MDHNSNLQDDQNTQAATRISSPVTSPVTSMPTLEPESIPTSTTPIITTLQYPNDIPGITTSTSRPDISSRLEDSTPFGPTSTAKFNDSTTTSTQRESIPRTTQIPRYHTELVEELRALKEDYILHGVFFILLKILEGTSFLQTPANVLNFSRKHSHSFTNFIFRPGPGADQNGNQERA